MQTDLDTLTQFLQNRLFVQTEASGRHVHLTKDQVLRLFGHDLTPVKELSQPGQYAAAERVTVRGPKGEFRNVAVLGPCRGQAQVEVSLTDCRVLGLQPPVRLSGEVDGSPGCVVEGELGSISLDSGVIVAKRHIHMSEEDANKHNVKHADVVKLKMLTDRPTVFEDVVVRVHPQFQTSVHLDYDEANACGWKKGDLGMILK